MIGLASSFWFVTDKPSILVVFAVIFSRRTSLRSDCTAHAGAVTLIQRFGSAPSFEEDSGVLGVKKELNCVPILLRLMQKGV